MKPRILEYVAKVRTLLLENEYQTAPQLAEQCHIKPSSIYKLIKYMRLNNIGILSVNKGYVLSKHANKSDDLNFIRRLYGVRASQFIAIEAAKKDINLRWNSVSDQSQLKLLLSPLSVNIGNSRGMQILLTKKNSKGT